jgi:hypothetical protein
MTLSERLEKAQPRPKPQPTNLPEWRRRALADQAKRGNVATKELVA